MVAMRDYTNGMNLGVGYNVLTGEPSIKYVNYAKTDTPGNQTGQTVDFLFKRITSTEELMTALGLGGGLNVNASWFKLEGSVKAKVFSELTRKVNSYSTFSLLYIKVQNIAQNIDGVDIDQSGKDLIKTGGLEAFHRRAGHEYIEGLVTGGEFISVVEIIAQDIETKEKVDAALNANISFSTFVRIGQSVDATLKLQSTFQELAQNKKVSIQVNCYRQGGVGDLPITPEQALEYAKNFPASVRESASILQVICKPYHNLPSYPDGMELLNLERKQRCLKSLWQQYKQALDTLSNVNYILKYPAQFDKMEADILNAGKCQLEERLDEIADLAMEYAQAPDKIKIDESKFPPIEVNLPLPKERSRQLGQALTISDLKSYQAKLIEYLELEVEPLARMGFDIGMQQVNDGYSLTLSSGDEVRLVFRIPFDYPNCAPDVFVQGGAGLRPVTFVQNIWQVNCTLVDIVSVVEESTFNF